MADRIVIGVPKGVEPELALDRIQQELGRAAEYWSARGMPAASYGQAVAEQCRQMSASAHVESRP